MYSVFEAKTFWAKIETDKEIRICLSVTADISNGLDEVLWCSGPFLILTHSVGSLPPSQTCK